MSRSNPRIQIRSFSPAARGIPGMLTAVSLHCHTCHSRENLGMVPDYARRLPMVSGMFQNSMESYRRHQGRELDFSKVYWTPPVSAADVVHSERDQIIRRLGLEPLVALSDHDDIQAGLEWNAGHPADPLPVGLEWSLPADPATFHLGVYNITPSQAAVVLADLLDYSVTPNPSRLADLLAWLGRTPDTLVVLNHPLWQSQPLPPVIQHQLTRAFLGRFGAHIHALEVNGYRPWSENLQIMELAERAGLPVVAGGDRHGCEPNRLLNLAPTASFAAFATRIREDRRNDILILPEYRDDILVRQFQMAADIVRTYAPDRNNRPHWTHRVFVNLDDDGARPLSQYWQRVGLPWMKSVIWLMRLLGSRRLRPALRLAFGTQAAVTS